MPNSITASKATTPMEHDIRRRTAIAAGVLWLGAAATAIYGSYGSSKPDAAQEHAVPWLIGANLVLAGLLFGLLVGWALRSATRSAGWGLALGTLGLLAVPIAFWSGVVVVIAGVGVMLAAHARKGAVRGEPIRRVATAGVVVGTVALLATTALLILGNTVLN